MVENFVVYLTATLVNFLHQDLDVQFIFFVPNSSRGLHSLKKEDRPCGPKIRETEGAAAPSTASEGANNTPLKRHKFAIEIVIFL